MLIGFVAVTAERVVLVVAVIDEELTDLMALN